MIHKILTSAYFENKPPVLIDVGASGEINAKWKAIAAYAICICFDADDRAFQIDEIEHSGYKKLIKIDRAIVTSDKESVDFYLTYSPYCSSTLEPFSEKLTPWIFNTYFDVVSKQKLTSTTLEKVLYSVSLDYIDWLKMDTQGTDLRLYTSLPQIIKQTVIAAEFEPGIIDAYKGEDKLHHILKALHEDEYWLCNMEVKGTQRIDKKYLEIYGQGNLDRAVPISPAWAELTYLKQANGTNIRSLFMLYIFALVQHQYGFAIEVCNGLEKLSDDSLIKEARQYILDTLKENDLKKLPFKDRVKNFLLRKLQ